MDQEKSSPTDEEISAHAHRFWEEDGRPEGQAEEHWRRAIEHLQGGGGSQGSAGPDEAP